MRVAETTTKNNNNHYITITPEIIFLDSQQEVFPFSPLLFPQNAEALGTGVLAGVKANGMRTQSKPSIVLAVGAA